MTSKVDSYADLVKRMQERLKKTRPYSFRYFNADGKIEKRLPKPLNYVKIVK